MPADSVRPEACPPHGRSHADPGLVRGRRALAGRLTRSFWVLADFVCSVQPGAADGVAFDGSDHVIKCEADRQVGGLVEGEELENIGVGSV
jgi:hypothetical protein